MLQEVFNFRSLLKLLSFKFMLSKLISIIWVLDSKFWVFNPYFESEKQFFGKSSQESLKQFTLLCDFIKVLISTSLIEVKDTFVYFDGQKVENVDIYALSNLIETTNMNKLFLSKYLLSKINLNEVEQLLEKTDFNLLKLTYESK